MTVPETRDDDLVERYQQANALDTRRPADRVGDAVRAHARMVVAAATQAPTHGQAVVSADRPAANMTRWKLAMVASLATFGLAGLLFVQLDRSSEQERELAMGPAVPRQPAPASVASRSEPLAPALPAADVPVEASPRADTALAKPARSPAKPSSTQAVGRPAASGPVPERPRSAVVAERQATAADRPAAVAVPDPAPAAAKAPTDAGAGIAELSRPLAQTESTQPGPSMRRSLRSESAGAARPSTFAAASPRANSAPVETSLHVLARSGLVAPLAGILDSGVAVDARDASGRTALMLAAMAGHAEMVQRLLAAGAKPQLRDHDQLTAAQLARARGFDAIALAIETGS